MTQPLPPTSPRKRRWVQPLAACLILALVGKFLYKPFQESFATLREDGFSFQSLHWQWLALCIFSLICVRLLNAINCRLILQAFGKPVPHRKIIPIIWSASLGRYIPGKVLTAGAVVMLVKIGVDWSTALAALGLSVALMALMSLVFAVPAFFFPPVNQYFHHPYIVTAVALLLLAFMIHPASFTRIANLGLKLIRRPPLPDRIHFPSLLKAFCISSVKVVLFGLALYSVGRSVAYIPHHLLIFSTGIAALASFSGFVAFPVPAGIGVHETIYLLMFQGLVPIPFFPIILYRIINFLVDILLGSVGLMTLDLTPSTPPTPCPSTP